MRNEVFNACRTAFCCGEDKVPWHLVLHALRQGLGFNGTYTLQPKDYEAWPILRDLVEQLRSID